METTARLFNCARCQCQVTICSTCDRGNIYCSRSCAKKSRKASLRAAARRYQNTIQGKFNHAARQRRYRERRKKVTHQGSPHKPRQSNSCVQGAGCEHRCHFCKKRISSFLRFDFLRREPKIGRIKIGAQPQAP